MAFAYFDIARYLRILSHQPSGFGVGSMHRMPIGKYSRTETARHATHSSSLAAAQ
jgi:hypothetical protein